MLAGRSQGSRLKEILDDHSTANLQSFREMRQELTSICKNVDIRNKYAVRRFNIVEDLNSFAPEIEIPRQSKDCRGICGGSIISEGEATEKLSIDINNPNAFLAARRKAALAIETQK